MEEQEFPDINAVKRLAAARCVFASFYHSASFQDQVMMDNLVRARLAFRIALSLPRANQQPSVRSSIERMTNETEQLFAKLRQTVMESLTYAQLDQDSQQRIKQLLFEFEVDFPTV